jgi:hypothetical protein
MQITKDTVSKWAKGYRATTITTVIEDQTGTSIITFSDVRGASMFSHAMLEDDEMTGPAATEASLLGAVYTLDEPATVVVRWNPNYAVSLEA